MARKITSLQINTKRLLLCPLTPKHSAMVLAYHKQNKAFFRPWLPAYNIHYFSEEFHRLWLKRDIEQMQAGQRLKLFIFHNEDTQKKRIIGDISATNLVRGVLQSCFVGYKMAASENGKGLMTEALAHTIQYLFEEMNLHRVEANIMLHNKASQRVVEKLGFEQEGLSKSYLKINGKWEDHYRYGLLNQNYRD